MAFTYLGLTHFDVSEYMFDSNYAIRTGTFDIEDCKFMFTDIFTVQGDKILKRIHFVDTALIINTFTKNFI
jgi:hypothetical protein